MSRKTIIIGSIALIVIAAAACFCFTDICCTKATVSKKAGQHSHIGEDCSSCGKNSCDKNCSSSSDSTMKNETALSCKLSTPELQKRKATVIANLKKIQKQKKELSNGFAFRYEASDENIDLLAEFIKSERQCCDFFNFAIRIETDNIVWLDITGPEGAKEFIKTELEM